MDFLRPSADVAATVRAVEQWLEAAEPAPALIETSGSTGAPKRVVLSRAAVLASAAATERRLGGAGLWALRLPTSYVAGLQVVVRSLLAGHVPIADFGGARFTSLVPTQLLRLLDDPTAAADLAALRGLDAVLLGGGPIDPSLRERAEQSGVRVIATYGAAETAGGCVYDGYPLDGVGVIVGADGRIRLGGPTIFDRYDADPELTEQVLVDGWFVTSDAGRIDEEGRLQVLGRVDDMVVSGGVNVPTPVIAQRLRSHPEVRAAEVLGVPDPEWGQRVVAFVVGELDLTGARDWVGQAHARAWAPRQVVAVPEIPLLANGKTDRQALKALAEQQS